MYWFGLIKGKAASVVALRLLFWAFVLSSAARQVCRARKLGMRADGKRRSEAHRTPLPRLDLPFHLWGNAAVLGYSHSHGHSRSHSHQQLAQIKEIEEVADSPCICNFPPATAYEYQYLGVASSLRVFKLG
jgi:hypothetical protein